MIALRLLVLVSVLLEAKAVLQFFRGVNVRLNANSQQAEASEAAFVNKVGQCAFKATAQGIIAIENQGQTLAFGGRKSFESSYFGLLGVNEGVFFRDDSSDRKRDVKHRSHVHVNGLPATKDQLANLADGGESHCDQDSFDNRCSLVSCTLKDNQQAVRGILASSREYDLVQQQPVANTAGVELTFLVDNKQNAENFTPTEFGLKARTNGARMSTSLDVDLNRRHTYSLTTATANEDNLFRPGKGQLGDFVEYFENMPKVFGCDSRVAVKRTLVYENQVSSEQLIYNHMRLRLTSRFFYSSAAKALARGRADSVQLVLTLDEQLQQRAEFDAPHMAEFMARLDHCMFGEASLNKATKPTPAPQQQVFRIDRQ